MEQCRTTVSDRLSAVALNTVLSFLGAAVVRLRRVFHKLFHRTIKCSGLI